jgi:hypothetical protein
MDRTDPRLVLGSTENQRQNLEQHAETLSLLADQLLAIGGEKVVVPADDPRVSEFWLTLVRRRGETFDYRKARLEKGEQNDCHANVVRLWRSNHGSICTGFALFADGYWRPHSWVRDKSGGVVETTELCDAYVGHEFDDAGAEIFAHIVLPAD